jgi:hypothetical protein
MRNELMRSVTATMALTMLTILAAGPGALAGAGTSDAPWARHTIHRGPRGADGVNLADVNGDGLSDVVTAWEEAGLVTVSLSPADPRQKWPTVTVGSGLFGVEDAVFGDINVTARWMWSVPANAGASSSTSDPPNHHG